MKVHKPKAHKSHKAKAHRAHKAKAHRAHKAHKEKVGKGKAHKSRTRASQDREAGRQTSGVDSHQRGERGGRS
ncbi:MAG: hypothetical protein WKF56_06835 [Candidatus Limnocylindrales bacterium]